MLNYLIRRLLQAIPILIGVTILTFILAKMMPGDPFTQLLNPGIRAGDLQRLREMHGLTLPLPTQYWNWVVNIVHGNLGQSFHFQQPVLKVMKERLGVTFSLAAMSLIISIVVALPLGVITAVRQNTATDYTLSGLTFVGISTPTFFMGLVAIFVALKTGWFPASGVVTPGLNAPFPWNYGDVLRHLFVPALVLAIAGTAGLVRYVRSSMLEVLSQDYVRTGRAKGLGNRTVLYKHALRNALIPVITILGLQLPFLFSGGIITEQVFLVPGIGRSLYTAVVARDYPVVMAVTLFLAILVVVGNLIADIGYALVDPRIQYS